MPDPIGTASGLLALVAFAFQSSKLLYQTVASFQSNQRTVRELKVELEALDGVLQSLHTTVTNTDVDLTTLELPLNRCGKACEDFEVVIVKCTAHSGGSRTSFRDWAKLKYMGDDIVAFKNMIAGYKSTIAIALADANIRTSAVTVSVLKEYKEMITNTTSDLKDHLQEIDKKLETLALQGASMSDEDAAERQQIQEERDSTQQCLGICAQVFTHIDQVQSTTFESVSTDSATYQGSVTTLSGLPSARLTADALTQCKEKLTNTTTQLERRLQNINILLQKISSQPLESSSKQATELERIEEEKESIKQCLAICAQASREADQDRTNVFEDISMADDGHQVLVSTIGDLISAKRVSAGARSMQLLGQMSDDSVQQLSRNCGHIGTEKATEPQTVIATQFEYRHGGGVKGSRKTERSRGDAKIEREQRDRT